MQKLNNKAMAILIALVLTISLTAPMMIQNVSAHSPPWYLTDQAYVAVAPNPVGVGQSVEVSLWTAQVLPNAEIYDNIWKENYMLTITAPDGTNTTQTWAAISNPTGATSTSFTPTTTGTWTFTFTYGGQTYPTLAQVTTTVPFTSAMIASINAYAGDVILPSTASCTLTVQQQSLAAPLNSYPLPTSYWTHPIEGQNTYWYTISSNWLATASNYFGTTFTQSGYNLFQSGGIGPTTGHVMWTLPIDMGGVVGGINTGVPGMYYYSGSSYQGRFANAIVMDGYLFFKMPDSDATTSGGTGNPLLNTPTPYVCYDLRTGQIVWENSTINPTWGEQLYFSNPNQNGVEPAYLWQTTTVGTNTTWIAYDAFTGVWIFNVTNIPTGTLVYDSNGNLDIYVLNYNTATESGYLEEWNLTDAIANGLVASQGVTIDEGAAFRPVENGYFNGAASTAYEWNVTINSDLDGVSFSATATNGVALTAPAIYAVIPGDRVLGTSSGIVSNGQFTPNPYDLWALNLNASVGAVGSLLWYQNYTAPDLMQGNPNLGAFTYKLGPVDPTTGVITMQCSETFQWMGYSIYTGKLLWGPTTNSFYSDYQYFGGGGGPGQEAVDAYGNIYVQSYSGVIQCINTATGDTLWTFGDGGAGNSTNDGLNSPWGLLPIFISSVCDGMVYTFTSQHGNGAFGEYKGEMIYCLNATTGFLIWQMQGESGQNAGGGTSTALIADGFLCYYNEYDNELYCVGQGPSQTTVTAPDTAVTVGTPLVIRGMVTDISAGSKQNEQAADFPNGVPCVSDASMSGWMQYVYMQQPEPTNATGVPVTISVVDPNGNTRVIGTATTDLSGMYTLSWAPDIPGNYTVLAAFAGTQSYWGSSDESSFVATSAPTVTPTASPPSNLATTSDLMTYIVVAVITIIIAIAIVGILLLRKHP